MNALREHPAGYELAPLDELALSAEVLERSAAGTLEGSLAGIVDRVVRAGGGALEPRVRERLADGLQGVARRIFTPLAMPAQASSMPGLDAGRLLAVETEGLSPEAAEFEAARQFVRLTGAAVAQRSLRDAVDRFAPGLDLGPHRPDRQHMRTKESPVSTFDEMGFNGAGQAEAAIYGEAGMNPEAGPYGEAENYGEAESYGEAGMYPEAGQYGEAENYGEAESYGEGETYPEAEQYGEGEMYPEAGQYGEGEMYPEAGQYGEGEMYPEAEQYGEGEMYPEAEQYGEADVYGETELYPEAEQDGEMPQPLTEVEEIDLASELIAVQSEQELDQFLGRLMSRTARRLVRSPAGRALGGVLKDAARRALPIAGGALGTYLVPGAGSALGARLGAALASTFEAEAAGLDPEQADFELARRYVRVASTAGRSLNAMPRGLPPSLAAQRALATATRRYPGAVRYRGYARGRQSGRWVRRGNAIIVIAA